MAALFFICTQLMSNNLYTKRTHSSGSLAWFSVTFICPSHSTHQLWMVFNCRLSLFQEINEYYVRHCNGPERWQTPPVLEELKVKTSNRVQMHAIMFISKSCVLIIISPLGLFRNMPNGKKMLCLGKSSCCWTVESVLTCSKWTVSAGLLLHC